MCCHTLSFSPLKIALPMPQTTLKKALPYLLSILFFALLAFVYFVPDVIEGKTLVQGDMQQGIALRQESIRYSDQLDEPARWTNSIFSGMPNYQISPSYSSDKWINTITTAYRLGLPQPISYIFIMLVGFYILLLTLGVKWHMAIWGAIAYAFSSYFFIIIEAGHIWKLYTLAYIPPTLAGIILAYKGRTLYGSALAAFFAMLQLASNHIQMSYYFMFLILAIVIAYFVEAYQQQQLPRFFKATGALVVAAILAVGAVLPNLYNTYEYSKETMRGKPALVLDQQAAATTNSSTGLSSDYITQWSYGVGETLTLLIPNFKGGATGSLAANKEAMEKVAPEFRQYMGQMNQYWGEQPFTSGPVYVGAFIVLLFVIGCVIVKGGLKWALLGATVLTVMLAWGKNFMPLTQLFIDYMPMYNKFRAVSSLLVVAEFTMPLLAVLAVKKIVEEPQLLVQKRKGILISVGAVGGLTLLAALIPSLFSSFLTQQEWGMMAQNVQYAQLFDSVAAARKSIFTADAWRSFFIIVAGAGSLYLYATKRFNATLLVAVIGVVTLGDLYLVNKRYLNSDNFQPKQVAENSFVMTAADRAILTDKDPHYRVLNLTVDPFNDYRTAYFHSSVGGYHAAKLRSYQDLIDHQLSKYNPQVLSMLNTKYLIVPNDQKQPVAQRNPDALGNAWFVDEVKWVDSPAEEMKALDTFVASTTAIMDNEYAPQLAGKQIAPAQVGDTIYLTSYKPNEITYNATSAQGGLALFSEVYYPNGWKVTIDGKPATELRANYLLRALYIPSGNHEVRFVFDPDSVRITQYIAYIAISLIIGLLLVALAVRIRK